MVNVVAGDYPLDLSDPDPLGLSESSFTVRPADSGSPNGTSVRFGSGWGTHPVTGESVFIRIHFFGEHLNNSDGRVEAYSISLQEGPNLVLDYVDVDGLSLPALLLSSGSIEDFTGPSILSGADVVTGSGFDDVLLGYAGNDRLVGLGGNDTLDGGAGVDTMEGSPFRNTK